MDCLRRINGTRVGDGPYYGGKDWRLAQQNGYTFAHRVYSKHYGDSWMLVGRELGPEVWEEGDRPFTTVFAQPGAALYRNASITPKQLTTFSGIALPTVLHRICV